MNAMTQTHKTASGIAIVQAVYAAYERRDFAAAAALFHPEGELYQTELLPWGGNFKGHAGQGAFMERLTGAIDTRIVGEQLFEAGDRVVSIGRTKGHARRSGVEFELPAVHVYTIRDGLISRYEAYVDTPGMLKALAG